MPCFLTSAFDHVLAGTPMLRLSWTSDYKDMALKDVRNLRGGHG
jgi:hypothetical protein